MNGALLVLALVAWLVVFVVVMQLRSRSRELQRVRDALRTSSPGPADEAVVEALEGADDRVAQAESMQHWLHGALDLTSDAIDVSIEETSTVRFGEFMNRVALPAMFGVFRVE